MTQASPDPDIQKLVASMNGFSPNEILAEGQLLVPMLMRVANEKGDSEALLCAKLQVTRGFLHQMRNDIRPGRGLSDEFLRGCAEYIGVPWLLLEIVVGRITVADAQALDAFAGSTLSKAFDVARACVTQTAA